MSDEAAGTGAVPAASTRVGALVGEDRSGARRQRGSVVNDFTVQVATVNGSGSQSSNLTLTRALFRMGIPVAPKNVFPSNIEGLPTWYDIRVSPRGYRARAHGIEVLVALNPQTWLEDVAEVAPGGVVVHESTLPLVGPAERDDIVRYPVPFTALAKEANWRDQLRKFLTNMLYVGVLAELLGIEESAVEGALRDQFRRKPAAVDTNMTAVRLGLSWARENLEKVDPFRVAPMNGTAGRVLLEGNQAAALGALQAGATVAAWYPITPSSSLGEAFTAYCERFRTDPDTGEHRYSIIQAEDELAALGIVLGATWAGARAFTTTSGPGISLMAEFTGLGYYAELPAVIFDIQRVGPSTGLPTRTMQGDVSFAYTLSHGDTRHIVLLPATVGEAYELTMTAFELADRFQTPVFVLSDLDLGMNLWMSDPLPYADAPFDRGRILDAAELERLQGRWGRYRDVEGDAIPYRTLPGTPHPAAGYFTRGSGHDEDARYSEKPEVYERNLARLARKHDAARSHVPAPLIDEAGAPVAVMAYGTTHHAVVEARDRLSDAGLGVDYLRVRALPFSPDVAAFVERHARVYLVEQNQQGQLCGLLRQELPGRLADRLVSVTHANGVPIDADVVVTPILAGERRQAHPVAKAS